MKAKHTPGPWEPAYIKHGDGENRIVVDRIVDGRAYSNVAIVPAVDEKDAESAADADLIAAAPDLLAAAEAHVASCGSAAIDCESCAPFKAAIAKARGE